MPSQVIQQQLSNQTWNLTNPGGNYTTNAYPSRIPTSLSPPANATVASGVIAQGDGVIAFGHEGEQADMGLLLVPIGVGADDNTFSLKVLGWRATNLQIGTRLWVPVPLMICQATLGSAAGLANADLGTSTLFADTVTCSFGPTWVTSSTAPVAPDWFQLSPADNTIALILCRSLGFRYLEVIFTTGGSATSCNALYCKL